MATASEACVVMTVAGVADELTRYLVALRPEETEYCLLDKWTRELNADGTVTVRGYGVGQVAYLRTLVANLPNPNGESDQWVPEVDDERASAAWSKLQTALLERKDAFVKVEYTDLEISMRHFVQGEYVISAETPAIDASNMTLSRQMLVNGEVAHEIKEKANPHVLARDPELVEEFGIAKERPLELTVDNLVKFMQYGRYDAIKLLS